VLSASNPYLLGNVNFVVRSNKTLKAISGRVMEGMKIGSNLKNSMSGYKIM
jgi:hypothetical protein